MEETPKNIIKGLIIWTKMLNEMICIFSIGSQMIMK